MILEHILADLQRIQFRHENTTSAFEFIIHWVFSSELGQHKAKLYLAKLRGGGRKEFRFSGFIFTVLAYIGAQSTHSAWRLAIF